MRVDFDADVIRRARNSPQVRRELLEFLDAKKAGKRPRRIDKPCGYDRYGKVVCDEHVRLRMRHCHLSGDGRVLLIYQHLTVDHIRIVDLTSHAAFQAGHERRWLYDRRHLIEWAGNEDILESLLAEFGNAP